MGAGKSTLGRHLSQILDYPFFDSDRVIEEKTGADIPWIFDMEGEAGFRRREQEAIDELTRQDGIVLATGGGVVVTPANRDMLHERGCVVYLWTPVDVQLARTRNDKNRPLLQTADPRAKLEALFAERDPLYRQVSHHLVSTASGNLKKVADDVLACLASHRQG
ncbi:MAG: shikimate kinase AroK [Alcanivorax sp.]|jgi:shikimate kinase|nr:shikimate kinase AroK [Alcanivorax sp.]MBU85615.1 shikimate kinase AroK [Alcanivorax sp.]SEG02864.1 shikimate kinase [Alcanivorax sp. DSM 26293]|tara:strand:+ start:2760 stop:3251 length:492 start_codon:yes stop_codon:yes gene_type:complete